MSDEPAQPSRVQEKLPAACETVIAGDVPADAPQPSRETMPAATVVHVFDDPLDTVFEAAPAIPQFTISETAPVADAEPHEESV